MHRVFRPGSALGSGVGGLVGIVGLPHLPDVEGFRSYGRLLVVSGLDGLGGRGHVAALAHDEWCGILRSSLAALLLCSPFLHSHFVSPTGHQPDLLITCGRSTNQHPRTCLHDGPCERILPCA